ncbi:putative type IX secretion system sortase PorU2 [Dyadobacter pollutisoli]|uniref:C25 family cysteine peptidase n=1 Tax=Dyadobacter pollutisoli TaxID=2910158 RepID=A0A9E8N8E4_9BACT|nr:C25 family cysteine peptidase [Dyadobacter pollutisoli]WAC11824.1 C25 family cysteine peptidase [Dyadobacter pollutisoli]
MNKSISTHLFFLLILLSLNSMSQVPWKGTYGNGWLVSGKKYVRLAITVKGIQQVNFSDLPVEFTAQTIDHEYLQLWHRGVQVDILSSDASKIIFYAEPNDGKFDELLCRPYANEPGITSRMNPYVSLFSDEGAYFLVLGTDKGLRANPINSGSVANPPVAAEAYHLNTDITTYKTDFSQSNSIFIYPTYLNSFYEYGKTLTGTRRFGNTLVSGFALNVKKLNAAAATVKPKVKVLLHSRSNQRSRDIRISVGPDAGNLRQAGSVNIAPFRPKEFEFELQLNGSLVGDIDANGVGTLAFQSNDNSDGSDIFSVSYYTVTYPQDFDMQGGNFYIFNIPPTAQSASRINLAGLPGAGTLQLFDISDADHPKAITNASAASFAIPRTSNATFNLLATTVTNVVAGSQMSMFTFSPIVPANYDYLIITTEGLFTAAQNYATYRAGTINPITKQSFKPLVLKIKDVYNQFNYGEPSAVAVRRCVDFLLSDGKRANKFLFLIGNATTYNLGTKNLDNEVPSIGYPGSDLLLVSGLGGETNQDIPAIPHGRLPTSDPVKAAAYLLKVQEYENLNNPVGIGYRKNVIHVAGGKTASEINTFSANLLNAANDFAANSPFTGDVFAFNKDLNNPCPAPVATGFTDCQTWADPGIITKVNEGAGALTYYGHGNPRVTDYFYGYVSDNGRGYTDNGKYSTLFFYGCDVNNVFRGFNETVSTLLTNNQRRPFTVDWLLTPNRGSVVVLGNTWEAYESILTPALDKEYSKVFTADHVRKPIGTILKETVAESIGALPNVNPDIPNYNYNFVQANLHQTLILGDPAIIPLLTTDPALPVELVSFTAKALDKHKVEVKWTTAREKNNSHFIVERSEDAKTFEAIGVIDGAGDNEGNKNYIFYDNNPLSGLSYYRLAQVDAPSNPGPGVEGARTNFRMVSVEIENSEAVVVSPNPSPSTFRIQLDPKMSIQSWNLLDGKGRILQAKGTGYSVDLTGYPSGVYFMEIATDKGDIFKRKLVKK